MDCGITMRPTCKILPWCYVCQSQPFYPHHTTIITLYEKKSHSFWIKRWKRLLFEQMFHKNRNPCDFMELLLCSTRHTQTVEEHIARCFVDAINVCVLRAALLRFESVDKFSVFWCANTHTVPRGVLSKRIKLIYPMLNLLISFTDVVKRSVHPCAMCRKEKRITSFRYEKVLFLHFIAPEITFNFGIEIYWPIFEMTEKIHFDDRNWKFWRSSIALHLLLSISIVWNQYVKVIFVYFLHQSRVHGLQIEKRMNRNIIEDTLVVLCWAACIDFQRSRCNSSMYDRLASISRMNYWYLFLQLFLFRSFSWFGSQTLGSCIQWMVTNWKTSTI